MKKKSRFVDFRGKKRRLSASKKVDLRILGAKKSRFNHQKIELKIFNAFKGPSVVSTTSTTITVLLVFFEIWSTEMAP